MKILQILAIITIFVVSPLTGRPPQKKPLTDLEFMDQVAMDESVGECMCPAHANYTGTWLEYCGRELSPPSKCTPETIYRCVNKRTIAIESSNPCAQWGQRCVPQTHLDGGACPMCKPHTIKTCIA